MRRSLAPWTPALLLGAGCLLNLSIETQRTVDLAAPLGTLPDRFEEHVAIDLAMSPEETRLLGASASINRAYRRDSASSFLVYVGFYASQRQGRTIHSPKNCLPGAGWEPLESRRETVAALDGGRPIRVNRFVIGKASQQALVYYWYQGRGRTESNEYQVKLDLIRDSALRRRSDEALVRIVVPFAGDPGAADALARRVVARWHSELGRILPS